MAIRILKVLLFIPLLVVSLFQMIGYILIWLIKGTPIEDHGNIVLIDMLENL